MTGILTTNIFKPDSLFYKLAGSEVEIIKVGLTRNELDENTYQWFKVKQVIIKYPYASFTNLKGETTLIYHECKIDQSKVSIK